MIIPPRLVFVAALTTCLASLWAQGQTPGPPPSEPSWVRGGAYRGAIDTLSPIEQITGMSDQAKVTMMVGSQDTVTPPDLSERCQAVAATLGKNIRLVQLEGKGHEIFLEPAIFAELTPLLN